MVTQPQPIVYWALACVIIFYFVFYGYDRTMSWKKKRRLASFTMLILTMLVVPFILWGVYNLNGISNGGLYEEYSDSFGLEPGGTYTSFILSNMFSEVAGMMHISLENGTCIFYLCDENTPEISYSETNITDGELILFGLPYHYTEFNVVARWTFNFYNPSLTEEIRITFFLDTGQTSIPPPPDPLYEYMEPTYALIGLWGIGGLMTLLARTDPNLKTTTSKSQPEQVVAAEPHEEEVESSRYEEKG
ncbi:MAG: hypothetical protein ACFFCX_16190 [Candidatus Sifarchaeia archaeon]